MPPSPRILSYEDLRETSEDFLAKYWPEGSVPVDIDEIVELRCEIEIAPVPDLYENSKVEGGVNPSGTRITVDQGIMTHPIAHRYRFTLAHELSHVILHRHLLASADFEDCRGWATFHRLISEDDWRWYEWQARSLAGLILVPTGPFYDHLETVCCQVLGESPESADFTDDPVRMATASLMAPKFEVSEEVMYWRGKYEDLWTYPPQKTKPPAPAKS